MIGGAHQGPRFRVSNRSPLQVRDIHKPRPGTCVYCMEIGGAFPSDLKLGTPREPFLSGAET